MEIRDCADTITPPPTREVVCDGWMDEWMEKAAFKPIRVFLVEMVWFF